MLPAQAATSAPAPSTASAEAEAAAPRAGGARPSGASMSTSTTESASPAVAAAGTAVLETPTVKSLGAPAGGTAGSSGVPLSRSKEFQSFRSNIPLQKKVVDQNNAEYIWKYYEYGPKTVRTPLVLFAAAGGTAQSFYKLFLALSSQGFRLIAVDAPPYQTHEGFCDGFILFLEQLGVETVHLFGTSLGGLLVQVFAHSRTNRVESLILCNAYCDTRPFAANAPFLGFFAWAPEFALKRYVLSNYPTSNLEGSIADSVDFMVEQVESLTHEMLSSRLTLNTLPVRFRKGVLVPPSHPITIIECLDEVAINVEMRAQLREFYPEAKVAYLKTGGNFPYLSRSDEIVMHIKLHFRSYAGAKNSPFITPEAPRAAESQSSS